MERKSEGLTWVNMSVTGRPFSPEALPAENFVTLQHVSLLVYKIMDSIQFNSLFNFTQRNTILYCLTSYLCH